MKQQCREKVLKKIIKLKNTDMIHSSSMYNEPTPSGIYGDILYYTDKEKKHRKQMFLNKCEVDQSLWPDFFKRIGMT